MVKLAWIRQLGRWTIHIAGNNQAFLRLVNRPLHVCLESTNIEIHLVRDPEGTVRLNGENPNEIEADEIRDAGNCLIDVLQDQPRGPFDVKFTSRMTPTFVEEFHDGEYSGRVKPRIWKVMKRYFRISNRDPELSQEMRRKVRHSWEPLLACARDFGEESDASAHFTILASGEVQLISVPNETAAMNCIQNVVKTWTFTPRGTPLDEYVYLEDQREP